MTTRTAPLSSNSCSPARPPTGHTQQQTEGVGLKMPSLGQSRGRAIYRAREEEPAQVWNSRSGVGNPGGPGGLGGMAGIGALWCQEALCRRHEAKGLSARLRFGLSPVGDHQPKGGCCLLEQPLWSTAVEGPRTGRAQERPQEIQRAGREPKSGLVNPTVICSSLPGVEFGGPSVGETVA